jgi:1,2-diacylglycerol 3-beta-galactosyltransferase
VKRALPRVPFVTILTDLADYPPHFWMERESEYLICGSDRAVEQARALGHTAQRVFRVAGMIMNPRFYEPVALDRAAGRAALGLEPDRPTGLILFGGQGSRVMGEIVRRLDTSDLDIQLIAICGHNAKLKENLEGVRTRIPLHVEGFTREVPRFMHLSDFFIGKPGPASLSEALHMRLPVVIESNAWTLPQERFNAEWVKAAEVGVVLRSFREVAEGVARLLDPARGERYRANAASIVTNAVFEIPGVLEQILDRHS